MIYFSYNEITKLMNLLTVIFISLFICVVVISVRSVVNGEKQLFGVVVNALVMAVLGWLVINPIKNAIESTYRPFLVNGVTYPLMNYEILYKAINSISGTYYSKNVTFKPEHALLCIFKLDVYSKISHFMRLYTSVYNSIHRIGIDINDQETFRNMKFALNVVKDIDLTVNNLAVMSFRHKAIAYLVRRQILIAIDLFTVVVKLYEAREIADEGVIPN